MKTSDRGIAALVAHEGIVPGPYRDSVGVWTYGVGHTSSAGSPKPVDMPRGMPAYLDAALVRVFEVFRRDLEKYEADVNRAFSRELTQEQFDAAVSFHFNTGAIGRASWVRSWNSGNDTLAISQIMNWKKPSEIIPRRRAEQRLFEHGEYHGNPIHVWRVTAAGKVVWSPVRTLSDADAIGLMRGAAAPDVEPTPAPEKSLWAVLFDLIARMFR